MPRPAPVTTATRPSKLYVSTRPPSSVLPTGACGLVPGGTGGQRGVEAQEVTERAADHGRLLVRRHAGGQLVHQLPAAAERPLGVWVVVAPDDGRQAGDVPAGDRDRIVL